MVSFAVPGVGVIHHAHRPVAVVRPAAGAATPTPGRGVQIATTVIELVPLLLVFAGTPVHR